MIEGSESGSGSISQRHGSADTDPHQNMDNTFGLSYLILQGFLSFLDWTYLAPSLPQYLTPQYERDLTFILDLNPEDEIWPSSYRASDCQCLSRISPGFDPHILRHSGI